MPPEWLATRCLLSQLSAKYPHRAYREKVQQYSEEKQRIWEDIKHGLIYGSQDFLSDLGNRPPVQPGNRRSFRLDLFCGKPPSEAIQESNVC